MVYWKTAICDAYIYQGSGGWKFWYILLSNRIFFFEGGTSTYWNVYLFLFYFLFDMKSHFRYEPKYAIEHFFKLSIFLFNHLSGKASNQNSLASFHEICIGEWFFPTLFFHDLSLSQSERTPLKTIICQKMLGGKT